MDLPQLILLYGGMTLLAASPILGRKKHSRFSIVLCLMGVLMVLSAVVLI